MQHEEELIHSRLVYLLDPGFDEALKLAYYAVKGKTVKRHRFSPILYHFNLYIICHFRTVINLGET